MLGDKIGLNICYEDKNVELLLNMQSIKNIYTFTSRNPFKVLQDFIGSIDKEDKDTLLTQVIYSLSNGDITIEDIYGYVLNIKEENKLELLIGIISLIESELVTEVSEEEDSTEDKKNTNTKEKEEPQDNEEDITKEIQNFIDWWDYYYYIATVVLKKTEEEFYKLTPRELKTLEALDSRYKRAILIKTYIDINTPRGEESDISTDKVYVDSFSDLF